MLNLISVSFTDQKPGEDEEMIDVEGYEDEDSMLRSIVNSQTDRSFAEALSQSQSSSQDNDDSFAEASGEAFDSILLQDLQHSDSDDSDDDDDDFPFGDGEDEEEEEEEEGQDLFDFPSPAPDNADESMDAMETNDGDDDNDADDDE